MAIKTINVNTKMCCTCDHYDCNRRPGGGGFIEVEGTNGKCYKVDRVNGWHQIWGGYCKDWTPWGPCKGWVR